MCSRQSTLRGRGMAASSGHDYSFGNSHGGEDEDSHFYQSRHRLRDGRLFPVCEPARCVGECDPPELCWRMQSVYLPGSGSRVCVSSGVRGNAYVRVGGCGTTLPSRLVSGRLRRRSDASIPITDRGEGQSAHDQSRRMHARAAADGGGRPICIDAWLRSCPMPRSLRT